MRAAFKKKQPASPSRTRTRTKVVSDSKKLIKTPKREVRLLKTNGLKDEEETHTVFRFPPKNDKCKGQRNPTEFERKVYVVSVWHRTAELPSLLVNY